MLNLAAGKATATVAPGLGGRVSSLRVAGAEIVVGEHDESGRLRGPLDWGIYPMAPFAGRVRDGQFRFRGREHTLDRRAAPHAIHGTVDAAAWDVVSVSPDRVEMSCSLGSQWPFDGGVRHVITLGESSLRMELTLIAHETMPAQVGWHPWFARPAAVRAEFGAWLPRDDDGMPTTPTSAGMPDLDGAIDDCFTGTTSVRVAANGVALRLTSDCHHWVVYTGADHGVCAEPQSGPPNHIENAPQVLEPGETLSRWFEIRWGSAGA